MGAPKMAKEYLGDSVYITMQNGMFTLTTENGYGPSNTIHLEIPVYEALVQYVERIKRHYAQPDTTPTKPD